MKPTGVLLLAVACALRSLSLNAEEPILFVPVVLTSTGFVSLPPLPPETPRGWSASLHAFNVSSQPVSISFERLYGRGSVGTHCDNGYYPLRPGEGRPLFARGNGFFGDACVSPSHDAPAFVAFRMSPGAVLSASVERYHQVCGCPEAPASCVWISEGRAPLPVFAGLFPGGSRAIAGAIPLGNDVTASCATGEAYRRRVNLTMLNGGERRSTIHVEVHGMFGALEEPPPVFQADYELAAGEVRQVNSLPIPSVHDGRVVAWIEVTSPEPFLFYVSAIADDMRPGAIPVEVHPGRLAATPPPPPIVLSVERSGGPLDGGGHRLELDVCGCVSEPMKVMITGGVTSPVGCLEGRVVQYPPETTVTIWTKTWIATESFSVTQDPHVGVTLRARCR